MGLRNIIDFVDRKKEKTRIKLDKELKEDVQIMAQVKNQSLSDFIEEAVYYYLLSQKRPDEFYKIKNESREFRKASVNLIHRVAFD